MGVSRTIPVTKKSASLLDIIIQYGGDGAIYQAPDKQERSRKSTRRRASGVTLSGNLKIDFGKRRVTRNGQLVKLTATEFNLIELLAPYTVGALPETFDLAEVWGPGYDDEQPQIKQALWALQGKLNDNLPWRRLLWAVCRTMNGQPALQRHVEHDDNIA